MDFLLNPNVGYVFLMGGVLFGMLALITPGTGLFEIGAFFCIAFAGYTVYNLSFNWWALLLLLLSLIPFIYALQKPNREIYLGLAILLIVVGSVFIFPRIEGGASVNPLVALVTSSLVAGFLWIAVRKSMEAASVRPSHDLEALVGRLGEARTTVHEDGSVQVGAGLWSARSEKAIPVGSSIRVIRREGFVVVVEKVSGADS